MKIDPVTAALLTIVAMLLLVIAGVLGYVIHAGNMVAQCDAIGFIQVNGVTWECNAVEIARPGAQVTVNYR